MKKLFSYMLITILSTSVFAQNKVIFDTDIGSDCDDAGAMAILHKLADKSEVEILGVVYSSGKNKFGIGVCDAINTYYDRGDLPLGQNHKDDVGDPRDFFSKKIATDTVTYHHDVISSAKDLVSAYKMMLEKEQDASVTIITVGHPIGLVHLLGDDEGIRLVRSKVSRWVAMGGGGWNFSQNGMAEYMHELLEKWPCKFYMSSYGEKVITGNIKLPNTPEDNPVRKAYESFIWNCLEKGRPSWDQIAVLFAVRPQYFRIESHGSVEQTEDKSIRWNNRTNNPKHYYVLPKISDDKMRDIIEDLMSERPGSAQRPGSSKDLNAVRSFVDNVLKYGHDTYSPKHTPLTVADGQLIHVDVFVSGTEGYHTFRIPSVARTADGTLHAFAEGRLTNRSDPGGTHIDLVYKRSTDDGKNWSTLILLDRHPDADINNLEKDRTAAANAVALVDRTNDRLWLFDTRLVDRKLGSFQAWSLYSDDSGVTWSRPQRIRVPRYELRGSSDIYPNLGSGIQMRSGRLIVPATRRTVGKTQSFALYSDDNGEEWHAGEVVEAAVNEAQIVELSDGRLLMSVRPNSGGDRLVALSSDSGEHWTKPAPLFSSTRVAEAIERYTREGVNDAQRNRLLHTIPAGGPLGARSNLEVRISYDEGVSFGISRTVYSGYAAYSDLVNIDSDRVGILWERGDTTSYQFITFTLVNRTFLEPD